MSECIRCGCFRSFKLPGYCSTCEPKTTSEVTAPPRDAEAKAPGGVWVFVGLGGEPIGGRNMTSDGQEALDAESHQAKLGSGRYFNVVFYVRAAGGGQ